MNPAERDEMTIGYFLSRNMNGFDIDFGARYDSIENKGSITSFHEEEHHDEDEDHDEEHHDEEEMETDYYDRSFNDSSFAFNIGRQLNDFVDINLGIANVEEPRHLLRCS